nr:MAG TPA: hypothetical protein [Caudoviricetes sp.]
MRQLCRYKKHQLYQAGKEIQNIQDNQVIKRSDSP